MLITGEAKRKLLENRTFIGFEEELATLRVQGKREIHNNEVIRVLLPLQSSGGRVA